MIAAIPILLSEKHRILFWNKVDVGDLNLCWEWNGGICRSGYGTFRALFGDIGYTYSAHRIAYFLKYGPIPDGLLVCHKCDNRSCCNPDHLFLGNHSKNAKDMVSKGRWGGPTGITGTHKGAKLKADQIIEIRRRYSEGRLSQSALASEYMVHQTVIGDILNRKTWKEVV